MDFIFFRCSLRVRKKIKNSKRSAIFFANFFDSSFFCDFGETPSLFWKKLIFFGLQVLLYFGETPSFVRLWKTPSLFLEKNLVFGFVTLEKKFGFLYKYGF